MTNNERMKIKKGAGSRCVTIELTDNRTIPTSFFQDRSNRTSGHWEKSDLEAASSLLLQQLHREDHVRWNASTSRVFSVRLAVRKLLSC